MTIGERLRGRSGPVAGLTSRSTGHDELGEEAVGTGRDGVQVCSQRRQLVGGFQHRDEIEQVPGKQEVVTHEGFAALGRMPTSLGGRCAGGDMTRRRFSRLATSIACLTPSMPGPLVVTTSAGRRTAVHAPMAWNTAPASVLHFTHRRTG